jgi:protein YibB
MKNISIVTSFFDIGRGEWTPDKGLPHYLERKTETYLERFGYLAQLENEIIIFTSEELAPKIAKYRAGKEDKTKIVVMNLQETFAHVREIIVKIQQDPEFKNRIHPSQIKNPEYWNADYVLVTDLKAFFVDYAIKQNLVSNDMVSWIDFGYCRSMKNIPESKLWTYDFDPNKIHLFSYKEYKNEKSIEEIVLSNDVYILGAKVVAHKNLWPKMSALMDESFRRFESANIVDDDQGLWLLSYIMQPNLFELHPIPDHQLGHDPFVLFNQFNKAV